MMKASVAKNIRQVLKFILFFGLGLFIIWLFQRNLTSVEKAEIWNAFRGADWVLVAMVAVFGLLSNVFRTLRWNMLLTPLGYKPRFHNTFLSVLVAYFANLAIPRLGEVMRCTFMYRYERIPVEKSLGTVVSERVIDMLCFLLVFVLSFCIEYKALHTYVEGMFNRGVESKVGLLFWAVVLMVAAVLAVVGFVLYYRRHKGNLPENSWLKKIAKIFNGFGEGLLSLRHLKHPWLFVLWSLGIWICYWFMSYCAFHSLEDCIGHGNDWRDADTGRHRGLSGHYFRNLERIRHCQDLGLHGRLDFLGSADLDYHHWWDCGSVFVAFD